MPKKPQAQKAVVERVRPRMSVTLAKETIRDLQLVREEKRLPNIGVTIDYVVGDWRRLTAVAPEATLEVAG